MSSKLSTTTTALVVHKAEDLRIEQISLPAPKPDEARVAIAYGGICGSDLHYVSHGAAGESILKAPMILGHEIVGTVLASAADGSGPAAGALVAVHPATMGDDSEPYPKDRPNLSPGGTYLGSAARFPHTDGAFAQEVNLPARMLRVLPEGVGLRQAALAEPASVAWHAVSRAGEVAGKRVLVIGAGPIGALAVAVLKRAQAGEIIAVDMFDAPLQVAAQLGATKTLKNPSQEEISAIHADVVIEASGNWRGLASAVRGAGRGARVVMVGLLPSGEQPALISLAISRELELVGALRFNDEMDQVLASLADGTLDISAAVTHEFEFTDALQAFETARDSSVSGKVLLNFQ